MKLLRRNVFGSKFLRASNVSERQKFCIYFFAIFSHVSKEMYDSIEQLLVELSEKLNSIGFDDETSDDDSSAAQQNFHSAHAESSKK